MARVSTHASLSKELLGDDVNDGNFHARMVELIRKRQQANAERLAKEKRDKSMTQAE